MSTEFWYFLMNGKYDNDTGVFGNFFAYAANYEEALQFAVEAASIHHIIDPCVEEAERLDIIPDYVRPEDLIQVTGTASMKPNLHTYPLDSGDVNV
jgi:hypothetical protein